MPSYNRRAYAIDKDIYNRRKELEERVNALMIRGFSKFEAQSAVEYMMRSPHIAKDGITEEGIATEIQNAGVRTPGISNYERLVYFSLPKDKREAYITRVRKRRGFDKNGERLDERPKWQQKEIKGQTVLSFDEAG